MRRAEPVIEFVGLPGSGKSTITRALPADWPTSRNTDPPPLPLARRLSFYAVALPFMLSLRPFALKDLHRLRRLAAELRFYAQSPARPFVIDQGLVQKLWSILHGRRRYDPAALERLVRALAPAAADLLVELATPPELAAQRLAARQGGNARLQRLPPGEMRQGLVEGAALYAMLMELQRRHCASRVLVLSGTDAVEVSAARVVAAVREVKHGL